MTTPTAPGLRHLLARLGLVEARVRRAVAAGRADDPAPDDPFRGLYLTPEAVDRVLAHARAPLAPDPVEEDSLAEVEAVADAAADGGADLRLRRVVHAFGLEPLDAEILLIALAPDVDPRFEQLYGYLNDDVTRRRATIGMALSLCGVPESGWAVRARLGADAPLVAGGLLVVEDPERPFLSRGLRVPDRVTEWLLGGDDPDPALTELVEDPPPTSGRDDDPLPRVLAGGAVLVHLREQLGGGGAVAAAAAARRAGRRPLVLDLARLAERPDAGELAPVAVREVRLTGGVLIGAPAEALQARPGVLRALTHPAAAVVLAGAAHWDPRWSSTAPLLLTAPAPSAADRAALWSLGLDGGVESDLDPVAASAQFALTPEQVVRAARSARLRAGARGSPVTAADLGHGIRAQNAIGLGRLARRIEPAVGWDDLVLPEPTRAALAEIALRARYRARVLGEWRMRPGGGRGRGVTALFAGDSGTGKSMSAEVVAGDLGMELYAVDLSSVVDKYIGETEKNLERIFTEAAGVNGVLLFDEADAIFGKRSEVRDAHDRYANIESAYLLQRMESFDGLAVLATNLRANLDDALTRRLDVVVDFPVPDADLRRRLWDRCLGAAVPRDPDLDLGFCATAFELSGGNIRSAVVAAAYLAARDDRPVRTADLVTGVHREYRKLGRLTLEAEFGEYYAALR
ncbi:ATP-binding protein [Geodermatophilus ruber]|uniref:ATPase family associated with various cellular activities (AAA) n=1 Tax=Geodermatophilus ruber TaxID=504800 RepID=A0A1I4BHC6_9ACTN|nr:ATP-binding protein [Geodermatophilus ruber]SFK68272.1 ATPase family associated with various cellular activities (AAA) [Geodermatophilus ruber]